MLELYIMSYNCIAHVTFDKNRLDNNFFSIYEVHYTGKYDKGMPGWSLARGSIDDNPMRTTTTTTTTTTVTTSAMNKNKVHYTQIVYP